MKQHFKAFYSIFGPGRGPGHMVRFTGAGSLQNDQVPGGTGGWGRIPDRIIVKDNVVITFSSRHKAYTMAKPYDVIQLLKEKIILRRNSAFGHT